MPCVLALILAALALAVGAYLAPIRRSSGPSHWPGLEERDRLRREEERRLP